MAKKANSKKKAVSKKVVAKKKAPAKKAVSKKAPAKKASAPKKAAASKKAVVTKSKIPANFNIDEITSLLTAVNESGVNELKLEKGSFKITIRQGTTQAATVVQAAAPVAAAPVAAAPAPAPSTAPTPAADAPVDANLITVKSPMIGTFYRSSSPDKPTFVNVGDSIKEGDVLCIVEAMKLFNEIESEISGTIVKVLVDDASPVEYDQPLFLVEP